MELIGNDGLAGQTLNINAEEVNGEVAGEFRVNDVVVGVDCANTETDGVVILGGAVTADPGANVGVGELLALIIKEGDPDSVALYGNDSGAGSCTDLLKAIPDNNSDFADVEDGSDIQTGLPVALAVVTLRGFLITCPLPSWPKAAASLRDLACAYGLRRLPNVIPRYREVSYVQPPC